MQRIFNPIDFGFEFADGWYSFDRKAAQSAALKARNDFVKQVKAQGKRAVTFNLPNQLITRGGIGSGNPQIEVVVNCYGVNVY